MKLLEQLGSRHERKSSSPQFMYAFIHLHGVSWVGPHSVGRRKRSSSNWWLFDFQLHFKSSSEKASTTRSDWSLGALSKSIGKMLDRTTMGPKLWRLQTKTFGLPNCFGQRYTKLL